jgi:hypothetical protein
MNNKKALGEVLALITFIALLLVLPPLPRTKARPQRIQKVNHLANVFIALPSTNALSATTPNQ